MSDDLYEMIGEGIDDDTPGKMIGSGTSKDPYLVQSIEDLVYLSNQVKAGTTYKFRVRAYKTVDGEQIFGEYATSVKTTTKTKAPKISSVTSKSKKATVKWGKVSGASGYEVYMATSKSGKYTKIKTAGKSTKSYTKSSLKKGKTYYFKVRVYKTVDGKKIYSSYSSVKNIKVK